MDPLTLFALANGAVSAVKAGCKLYKDIKSAAGDVKDVIKDLDEQFHNAYAAKGKTPSIEAKNQFIQEKNRVIELNKKGGDTTNIYTEIGEHLGTYYDNYYKCLAVFEEEERRGRNEVYTGEDSLGKRALQRVLMKKQLEAMATELRELMVYQSPPELGALWTDVEEMMKEMGKQQKVVIAKHMKEEALREKRRRAARAKAKRKCFNISAIVFVILFYLVVMWMIIEHRKEEYPELGQGIIPERVSNYDQIIAERNRKYWEQRMEESKRRTTENLWKKKE